MKSKRKPCYAAKGLPKVPGKPKGTDIIPAWLTPGEAVLSPGAAEMLGRGNVQALNKAASTMRLGTPQYKAEGGMMDDEAKRQEAEQLVSNPDQYNAAQVQAAQAFLSQQQTMQQPQYFMGGTAMVPRLGTVQPGYYAAGSSYAGAQDVIDQQLRAQANAAESMRQGFAPSNATPNFSADRAGNLSQIMKPAVSGGNPGPFNPQLEGVGYDYASRSGTVVPKEMRLGYDRASGGARAMGGASGNANILNYRPDIDTSSVRSGAATLPSASSAGFRPSAPASDMTARMSQSALPKPSMTDLMSTASPKGVLPSAAATTGLASRLGQGVARYAGPGLELAASFAKPGMDFYRTATNPQATGGEIAAQGLKSLAQGGANLVGAGMGNKLMTGAASRVAPALMQSGPARAIVGALGSGMGISGAEALGAGVSRLAEGSAQPQAQTWPRVGDRLFADQASADAAQKQMRADPLMQNDGSVFKDYSQVPGMQPSAPASQPRLGTTAVTRPTQPIQQMTQPVQQALQAPRFGDADTQAFADRYVAYQNSPQRLVDMEDYNMRKYWGTVESLQSGLGSQDPDQARAYATALAGLGSASPDGARSAASMYGSDAAKYNSGLDYSAKAQEIMAGQGLRDAQAQNYQSDTNLQNAMSANPEKFAGMRLGGRGAVAGNGLRLEKYSAGMEGGDKFALFNPEDQSLTEIQPKRAPVNVRAMFNEPSAFLKWARSMNQYKDFSDEDIMSIWNMGKQPNK